MNKLELATKVCKKTNLSKKDVLNCINAFTSIVKESVRSGESINIKNFGSFSLKYRKEKLSLCVANKKPVLISARKMPVFRPTQSFKDVVNF